MSRRAITSPTVLAVGFLFLLLIVFNVQAASDGELLHKLQQRTTRLEQTVLRTLSSLSLKLGQPFEEIALLFDDEIKASTTLTLEGIEERDSKGFDSFNEIQLLNITEVNPGDTLATHNYVTNQMEHFKGAVKCSLFRSTMEKSLKIRALLNSQESLLALEWSLPLEECHDYNSGVWLRITDKSTPIISSSKQQMQILNEYIPEQCLTRSGWVGVSGRLDTWSSSYVINYGNETSLNDDDNLCHHSALAGQLEECKIYSVEVLPEYRSLSGKIQSTDIIMPIQGKDTTESFNITITSAGSIGIQLTVRSISCARQLTSVFVDVYPDGEDSPLVANSIQIPRSCFAVKGEVFTTLIGAGNHSRESTSNCNIVGIPINWQPLNRCRQYKIVLVTEYSSQWKSKSFVWNHFLTAKEGVDGLSQMNISKISLQFAQPPRCQQNQFPCHDICIQLPWVCDGMTDCPNGEDEMFCSDNEKRQAQAGAFKCDQQFYIMESRVCDGNMDCFDGSDEVGCVDDPEFYCTVITSPNGSFSNQQFIKDRPLTIHGLKIPESAAAHLISVQNGHFIWLNLKLLKDCKRFTVQIFDGAYPSASNLIFNHTHNNYNPEIQSVRSTSNHMYIVYSILKTSNSSSDLTFFYTSIEDADQTKNTKKYNHGCGGYMVDNGIMRGPTLLAHNQSMITQSASRGGLICEWYIETEDANAVLLVNGFDTFSNLISENVAKVIKIYEGWDRNSEMTYSASSEAASINNYYSTTNAIRVVIETSIPYDFDGPLPSTYTLRVSKIANSRCRVNLTRLTGVVATRNYPMLAYSNMSDCRWQISVDAGYKIRLTFASFKTEDSRDFVYIYDGSTLDASRLLLQVSGLDVAAPFTVNSTSNEMLVRFTSDEVNNEAGFIAVYSMF